MAFCGSLLAVAPLSRLFADRAHIPWFAFWTAWFAILLQVVISSGGRKFLSIHPISRALVLVGLGIVTLAMWILLVAVAGITLGLYAHRVLNSSGISAWGIGTAMGIVALIIVETSDQPKNAPD